MNFESYLYDLQHELSIKHPASKADLFIEFLRQKRELVERLREFEKFTSGSFKEELNDIPKDKR